MLSSEFTFDASDGDQYFQAEEVIDERALPCGKPNPTATTALIALQIQAEIPFLRRVVKRWHREAADADDLVQDTLLRALANAHLWQPGSNLQAWLTTIMRNQFLATISRSRLSGASEGAIEADHHIVEHDAEVRLTLRDVRRALERLPTKQRATIKFACIEGKSYSEVASLLGVSVDAVRCHLARARDRLRTAVHRPDETTWLRPATARPRTAGLVMAGD